MQAPAPHLCVEALRVVSSKRSQYEDRRSWLLKKIEHVLKDYTDRHLWGRSYKILYFGVEERNQGGPPSLICAIT